MAATPTTLDYTQSELPTRLGWLTPTQVAHFEKLYPNGAVIETDTGGPYVPVPQILDANGNAPEILYCTSNSDTVDTSQFSNLHQILLDWTGGDTVLTVEGASDEYLYIQPGAPPTFHINDDMSNNKLVISGGNLPNSPSVVQIDAINQTLVDRTGGQTFNIENANDVTLKLGSSGDNTVNIAALANTTFRIDGLTKTDVVNFGDTQANATITEHKAMTTAAYTTVDFASCQHVTLAGIHDAVTFAGDPSIHYI
jgi:hypothetical protein